MTSTSQDDGDQNNFKIKTSKFTVGWFVSKLHFYWLCLTLSIQDSGSRFNSLNQRYWSLGNLENQSVSLCGSCIAHCATSAHRAVHRCLWAQEMICHPRKNRLFGNNNAQQKNGSSSHWNSKAWKKEGRGSEMMRWFIHNFKDRFHHLLPKQMAHLSSNSKLAFVSYTLHTHYTYVCTRMH